MLCVFLSFCTRRCYIINSMLTFDIITIFPHIFDSYFQESILKRAQRDGKIRIRVHNLRRFTKDRHRIVDDKPFGGGPGMILKVDPIHKAVRFLVKRASALSGKSRRRPKVILFSAAGRQLDQHLARVLVKMEHIVFICGRYEGVDARVARHIADMELSIGPYVLTGGEVPAMVVVDAVTRLLPGVLGNAESLKEESFAFPSEAAREQVSEIARHRSLLEYPQYTRPEVFYQDPRNKRSAWRVPKVLLSGDHAKIKEWQMKHTKHMRS